MPLSCRLGVQTSSISPQNTKMQSISTATAATLSSFFKSNSGKKGGIFDFLLATDKINTCRHYVVLSPFVLVEDARRIISHFQLSLQVLSRSFDQWVRAWLIQDVFHPVFFDFDAFWVHFYAFYQYLRETGTKKVSCETKTAIHVHRPKPQAIRVPHHFSICGCFLFLFLAIFAVLCQSWGPPPVPLFSPSVTQYITMGPCLTRTYSTASFSRVCVAAAIKGALVLLTLMKPRSCTGILTKLQFIYAPFRVFSEMWDICCPQPGFQH